MRGGISMLAAGLVCLAVAAIAGAAYAGQAKHWICTKCGKRACQESRPSLSGCPEGGTHSWAINY